MTKILAPGAVCVIPDILGGCEVTAVSDRLFARTGVEEVYLPRSLQRIGRYAFYNCERLKCLHFYNHAVEIGGGLFNGCRNVREFHVHMERDERSGLRDFVTEISERLMVRCYLEDGAGEETEVSRLIFPVYYDEAVENTPARIISSSIHGSGQRYRYCFEDKKIRYDRYDRQFFYEKNEEGLLPAAEIAVFRLMFPHGLWEDAKKTYGEFLRTNLKEILLGNIDKTEIFKWLVNYFEGEIHSEGRLGENEIKELTEAASRQKRTELSSLLMELRHQKFKPSKKSFDF